MKRMLAIVILLLTSLVHAESTFSVAVGNTFAYTQGSGTWWQDKYPSYYEQNSPSITLRIDTPLRNNWSMGYGYTYIGNFNSDSLAVGSDLAYAKNLPFPLSRWIGNQKMDGIFLVARKTYNPWYVEGGLMYTRTSFTMNIPDWVPCKDWQLGGACVMPDPANMRPVTIGVPDQRRFALVFGGGYQVNEKLSVQLNFYPTEVTGSADLNGYGGPGIVQYYSPNISLVYKF
jgi:hypothetical protein